MSVVHRIGNNISEFLGDIQNLITSLYFWIGLALFLFLDYIDRYCTIFIQLTALSNFLPIQIIFSLITIGAYALIIFVAYKFYRSIQKRHHIHTTSFNLKRIGEVIVNHAYTIFLWLIAIVLTNGVCSEIVANTSKNSGNTENQNSINQVFKISPASAITMGIVAIILGPILEELLDRGVFYNLFNFSHLNIITKTLVIILDGTLFSSGHMATDFAQFFLYFAMGVVLSLCYLTSHSLTCSTTLHASINLISTASLIGSLL